MLVRAVLFLCGLQLLAAGALAERHIMEIWQPLSLLGTETEDEPLKDAQWMAATLASTPVLVGGAFPESPVEAMCLPHKLQGATAGFPDESNLIVLTRASLHAEWGEKSHLVVADFSKARCGEDMGVTMLQVMQLTAECLRRNLQNQGDGKPIRIQWILPSEMKLPKGTLPDSMP